MPATHGEIIELYQECDRQAERPPISGGKPDPYIPMFSVALQHVLDTVPDLHAPLASSIHDKREVHKKPFPPNMVYNMLLRLAQKEFISEKGELELYPLYPFEKQDYWNGAMRKLFENAAKREELCMNLEIWNVGSDIETRVAGPKIVAATLMPERLADPEKPMRILNVGSARNHSLAMLVSGIKFPHVEIDRDACKPEVTAKMFENMVNRMLAREVILGESYGVDMWPLRDRDWGEFLRACRYYPGELHDHDKRMRYQLLERARDNHPNIHHVAADFSLVNQPPNFYNDYRKGTGINDEYDLIIYSTMIHQNNEEKRRALIDNGKPHLAKGGKMVINEFIPATDVIPDREKAIIHPIDTLELLGPTSEPYTYTTMLYDPYESDSIDIFIRWFNGRCEKFIPGKAFLEALRKKTC